MPFLAWFVTVLGLTFLISGIGVGIYTVRFVQMAEPIEGVVVGLVERQDRNDDGDLVIGFAPTIKFSPPNGETTTIQSSSYSSKYEIGDSIDVLYDPDDLSNAMARDDLTVGWIVAAIFPIVGLLILVIMGFVIGSTGMSDDGNKFNLHKR